jgi:hypothetical protein
VYSFINADLVFVAISMWTSVFLIFFNRILPTLDVRLLLSSMLRPLLIPATDYCRNLDSIGCSRHVSAFFRGDVSEQVLLVTLVCFSTKAAAGRRSASFALGHFDPSPSGWTPGWSFFIGLLPVRAAIHLP